MFLTPGILNFVGHKFEFGTHLRVDHIAHKWRPAGSQGPGSRLDFETFINLQIYKFLLRAEEATDLIHLISFSISTTQGGGRKNIWKKVFTPAAFKIKPNAVSEYNVF